jgi:hypothetical protein
MPKPPPRLNPKSPKLGQSSGGRIAPARPGKPSEIKDLLSRSGLAQAARKFEGQQRDWRDFFAEKLEPRLLEAIVHYVEREGTLTLHASSASWAARLRFALPALTDEAKTFRPAVKKFVVKIQPVAASTGART